MFARHLEVMCVLGIKIDSLVHSVMEERGCVVQSRPTSNLLRSTIWITSGVLAVIRIFAHILATSLSVAHHWTSAIGG